MDQPASAVVKYYTNRQRHIETGRRWDGPLHARTISAMWVEAGMAPLPDDFNCNEVIPDSPERARAIRMEDRQAVREAEAARAEMTAKIATQSDGARRLAELEATNAQMRAQIAELMGTRPEPPQPLPPAPSATPGPAVDGLPTEEWTKNQIANWAKENGQQLTATYIQTSTKATLLNKVLTDVPASVTP